VRPVEVPASMAGEVGRRRKLLFAASTNNGWIQLPSATRKVAKDGELAYTICANKSSPYRWRARWECCTANSPKENVIKSMH
jgi:hypothetical protein